MADDALRGDLANSTEPTKGATLVGYNSGQLGDVGQTCAAILRSAKTPEQFGAVEGPTDSTIAFANLFAAAAADNSRIKLPRNSYYTVSGGLVLPDGLQIEANGGEIAVTSNSPDTLSGGSIHFGNNTYTEGLRLKIIAEKTSFVLGTKSQMHGLYLYTEDALAYAKDGRFRISPDAAYFDGIALNIRSPWYCATTDASILDSPGPIIYAEAENFIQGLYIKNADNWIVRRIRTHVSHPEAAKEPGHNGLLIEGCWNWSALDVNIEDCGEHAVRFGGSDRVDHGTVITGGWFIDNIRVRRSGGCGLKQWPGEGKQVGPGRINSLIGQDIGETTTGRNQELWRASNVTGVSIGYAEHWSTSGKQMTAPFQFNGATNCSVDSYYIQSAGTLVRIADTESDAVSAPVHNVRVINGRANVDGYVLGLIKTVAGATVGGIEIGGDWTGDYALGTVTASEIVGEIVLRGTTHNTAVPVISGITEANSRWFVQEITNINPTTGMVSRSFSKRSNNGAAFNIESPKFEIGNVSTFGVLSYTQAESVLTAGMYGASWMFSRPGRNRPGWGVVTRLYSATETDLAAEVHMATSSTVSNNTRPVFTFRQSGDVMMQIPGSGLVQRSPDGTFWKQTIANDGTVTWVSIPDPIPT